MGVVGRVQEVALVLLGGSWLVKEQLGVGWVLPPTSTLTAWPYSDLLLRRSLGQETKGIKASTLLSASLSQINTGGLLFTPFE